MIGTAEGKDICSGSERLRSRATPGVLDEEMGLRGSNRRFKSGAN